MMDSAEGTGRHHLRIPFRLQILYGSRKFYTVFAVGMAAFFLYGPIPLRMADHNGYRYVLGPLACSVAALLFTLVFPFKPYRSARWSEPSLQNLDERDPDAHRFMEILRSPEYKRVSFLAALKLAAILSAIMLTIAAIFHESLSWTLNSPWTVPGLGGGALMSFIFIKVRSISWALTTWWEEAGEPRTAEVSPD